MTGTVEDTRIIFGTALKACGCSIILAHNHLSGNPKSSDADLKFTKILVQGRKILEIMVLDHIILTYDTFYIIVR
jgi:DNA repair protein RadC